MPDMTIFNDTTIDTELEEPFQTVSCMACGAKAEISGGTTDKGWAEVRRGALAATDTDGYAHIDNENIKFSRHICPTCFMEDPALCAFFNRCGCRVR